MALSISSIHNGGMVIRGFQPSAHGKKGITHLFHVRLSSSPRSKDLSLVRVVGSVSWCLWLFICAHGWTCFVRQILNALGASIEIEASLVVPVGLVSLPCFLLESAGVAVHFGITSPLSRNGEQGGRGNSGKRVSLHPQILSFAVPHLGR
jgi:hypothetical protein